MTESQASPPRVPPRWFVHIAWRIHRGIYRITGGRKGLWVPQGTRKWGAFRLTTTGRRSGNPHSVILAYFEDGPNVVTMAMNGWGEGHPAWWLNLQANPAATAEVDGVVREVVAHAAAGEEHDQLWARWQEFDAKLGAYAAARETDTAVVVLVPAGLDGVVATAGGE